ncbi:hypothetical protein ES332_D03G169100v1 [Gossypium tomentosum]|uniref:Uncharacterized protein n=1 Tax=Gossypium tomentosum TaxID=34277 RepID=A0A5D2LQR9_GOSTO|nr:hypothetical protein ES332_D03G169100v1 [Gossypium tomentosum]
MFPDRLISFSIVDENQYFRGKLKYLYITNSCLKRLWAIKILLVCSGHCFDSLLENIILVC